jgi:hypothetical protein
MDPALAIDHGRVQLLRWQLGAAGRCGAGDERREQRVDGVIGGLELRRLIGRNDEQADGRVAVLRRQIDAEVSMLR